jgi:hypothetical protein
MAASLIRSRSSQVMTTNQTIEILEDKTNQLEIYLRLSNFSARLQCLKETQEIKSLLKRLRKDLK